MATTTTLKTTTLRVSTENRDALAKIAESELDGASMDEALRTVLFERETVRALARLKADPEEWEAYQRETRELAEVAVEVPD